MANDTLCNEAMSPAVAQLGTPDHLVRTLIV